MSNSNMAYIKLISRNKLIICTHGEIYITVNGNKQTDRGLQYVIKISNQNQHKEKFSNYKGIVCILTVNDNYIKKIKKG